jgi:hypothetical protein
MSQSEPEPAWSEVVPTRTLGLLLWVVLVPVPFLYVVWNYLVVPSIAAETAALVLVWLLVYNVGAHVAGFDVRSLARDAAEELTALYE